MYRYWRGGYSRIGVGYQPYAPVLSSSPIGHKDLRDTLGLIRDALLYLDVFT